MMSDLKVGDKVRVRRDAQSVFDLSFTPRMEVFRGCTFEIRHIYTNGRIALAGTSLDFVPEWLEKVEETPKSTSILLEAENIVNGERGSDYGDAVDSFNRVAEMATMLTGVKLTADVCCKVMMAVKLTRQSHKHKRDNLVDLAGYAEILNRIKERQNGKS